MVNTNEVKVQKVKHSIVTHKSIIVQTLSEKATGSYKELKIA